MCCLPPPTCNCTITMTTKVNNWLLWTLFKKLGWNLFKEQFKTNNLKHDIKKTQRRISTHTHTHAQAKLCTSSRNQTPEGQSRDTKRAHSSWAQRWSYLYHNIQGFINESTLGLTQDAGAVRGGADTITGWWIHGWEPLKTGFKSIAASLPFIFVLSSSSALIFGIFRDPNWPPGGVSQKFVKLAVFHYRWGQIIKVIRFL